MEKVVLAYSGGLDTSVILKWLIEKGYQVVCYVADVGQKDDFDAIRRKALAVGAAGVYVEDLKEEFVNDFIFAALRGGAIYEGRYLLGTSLARPVIAKRQIEVARREKATAVSHGSTGKGNDQVRFELTYLALEPSIKIIAPWKDAEFLAQFQGRTDLLNYAEKHGIPVEATKKAPYSMDANLMHISYEAGILEDPKAAPPKEMFRLTVDPKDAPEKPARLSVEFRSGIPVKATNLDDNTSETEPLKLFGYLNTIGGAHGVGRVDIVENRFVGIKSRGVYETPGGTILFKAHQDLETITIDREVFRIKETLVPKFAELIYYGFWFAPEFEFLSSVMNKTQEVVNGTVYLELYKGNITVTGRESPNSLYDPEIASMDVEGGYDQKDAAGFIRINSIRLKAQKRLAAKLARK
jgi:argininosuccinate synthase